MLARFVRVCVVLAAVVLVADRSLAQPCVGATGLVAKRGLCSVELSWSAPPNVFITIVRWSTSDNFASSTAIATFTNSTESYLHTLAVTGDNYYWVVTSLLGSPTCSSVTAGPVVGSPLDRMPSPSVTVNCSSVVVSTSPVPNATNYTLIRTIYPSPNAVAIAQGPTPQFTDTTGVPGTPYVYGIFVNNASCSINSGSGFAADFGGKGAFAEQPGSVAANVGQTVTLNTLYVRNNAGTTQWYKDGVALSNNQIYSNVNGSSLTINNVKWAQAGVYTLRHTTSCGQTISEPAYVVVRENPCRIDFNDSGAANLDDVFIYLNAWFAGCP